MEKENIDSSDGENMNQKKESKSIGKGRFYGSIWKNFIRNPLGNSDQNIDSWDRFFNATAQIYRQGIDVTEACNRMCNIMLTRDEKMRLLIKENFKPEDCFQIRSRMIGGCMLYHDMKEERLVCVFSGEE